MTESPTTQAQRDDSKPGTRALARGLQPCGKCLGAGTGGEPFQGAGVQAGKQVMLDAQPGSCHTIWSPLCGWAAHGLHQALLLHEALLGEVERGIWDVEQPRYLLG